MMKMVRMMTTTRRTANGLTRSGSRVAVLVGLSAVVVLSVGLNITLDYWKPDYRDPEYGHREMGFRTDIAETKPKTIVAALGSSRSEMGFNPAVIHLEESLGETLVYNVSQAGCGPVGEILNLKRLLAAGVKPDAVCIEILPPVLAGTATADKLLIPLHLSYADLGYVDAYLGDREAFEREWLRLRVNPWFSYRQSILNHWGGRSLLPIPHRLAFLWRDLKPFGWLPYVHAPDAVIMKTARPEGIARAKAEYATYLTHFSIAEIPRQAYADLVELCRSRGIRVAFYTMPESPTFRSWYTPEIRAELERYYEAWRKHGVPVFDCSNWLPDETWFADGHHLMRHGANAFSERFGRECLGPWLGKE